MITVKQIFREVNLKKCFGQLESNIALYSWIHLSI